jgi:hypothetical protein
MCVLAGAFLLCPPVQAREDFDHDHQALTRILRAYVFDGNVAYAELKGDPAELEHYLETLTGVSAVQYSQWGSAQQLAFWLNAYNAFVIKLIVDHHPVDAIRSIGDLPGSAMKLPFIGIHVLGSLNLSLDDIYDNVLRKRFADPRVHLAVCAAVKSGPALRTTAFKANALESQLDDAAFRFVNDERRNSIDVGSGRLRLSPLFRKFRGDFERHHGTLLAFLALYLDGDGRALRALGHRARVEFSSFDGSLNGY